MAMDLSEFTKAELELLRVEILTELERRQFLETAEQQADDLSRRYQEATGRTEGSPWVQPTGAHDAYPQSSVVLHKDKVWESLTPANVWEPGVSGWREIVKEDETPAFVQPTGSHDAYHMGDKVLFEGKTYESTANKNVWSPTNYPAGWKQLS